MILVSFRSGEWGGEYLKMCMKFIIYQLKEKQSQNLLIMSAGETYILTQADSNFVESGKNTRLGGQ